MSTVTLPYYGVNGLSVVIVVDDVGSALSIGKQQALARAIAFLGPLLIGMNLWELVLVDVVGGLDAMVRLIKHIIAIKHRRRRRRASNSLPISLSPAFAQARRYTRALRVAVAVMGFAARLATLCMLILSLLYFSGATHLNCAAWPRAIVATGASATSLILLAVFFNAILAVCDGGPCLLWLFAVLGSTAIVSLGASFASIAFWNGERMADGTCSLRITKPHGIFYIGATALIVQLPLLLLAQLVGRRSLPTCLSPTFNERPSSSEAARPSSVRARLVSNPTRPSMEERNATVDRNDAVLTHRSRQWPLVLSNVAAGQEAERSGTVREKAAAHHLALAGGPPPSAERRSIALKDEDVFQTLRRAHSNPIGFTVDAFAATCLMRKEDDQQHATLDGFGQSMASYMLRYERTTLPFLLWWLAAFLTMLGGCIIGFSDYSAALSYGYFPIAVVLIVLCCQRLTNPPPCSLVMDVAYDPYAVHSIASPPRGFPDRHGTVSRPPRFLHARSGSQTTSIRDGEALIGSSQAHGSKRLSDPSSRNAALIGARKSTSTEGGGSGATSSGHPIVVEGGGGGGGMAAASSSLSVVEMIREGTIGISAPLNTRVGMLDNTFNAPQPIATHLPSSSSSSSTDEQEETKGDAILSTMPRDGSHAGAAAALTTPVTTKRNVSFRRPLTRKASSVRPKSAPSARAESAAEERTSDTHLERSADYATALSPPRRQKPSWSLMGLGFVKGKRPEKNMARQAQQQNAATHQGRPIRTLVALAVPLIDGKGKMAAISTDDDVVVQQRADGTLDAGPDVEEMEDNIEPANQRSMTTSSEDRQSPAFAPSWYGKTRARASPEVGRMSMSYSGRLSSGFGAQDQTTVDSFGVLRHHGGGRKRGGSLTSTASPKPSSRPGSIKTRSNSVSTQSHESSFRGGQGGLGLRSASLAPVSGRNRSSTGFASVTSSVHPSDATTSSRFGTQTTSNNSLRSALSRQAQQSTNPPMMRPTPDREEYLSRSSAVDDVVHPDVTLASGNEDSEAIRDADDDGAEASKARKILLPVKVDDEVTDYHGSLAPSIASRGSPTSEEDACEPFAHNIDSLRLSMIQQSDASQDVAQADGEQGRSPHSSLNGEESGLLHPAVSPYSAAKKSSYSGGSEHMTESSFGLGDIARRRPSRYGEPNRSQPSAAASTSSIAEAAANAVVQAAPSRQRMGSRQVPVNSTPSPPALTAPGAPSSSTSSQSPVRKASNGRLRPQLSLSHLSEGAPARTHSDPASINTNGGGSLEHEQQRTGQVSPIGFGERGGIDVPPSASRDSGMPADERYLAATMTTATSRTPSLPALRGTMRGIPRTPSRAALSSAMRTRIQPFDTEITSASDSGSRSSSEKKGARPMQQEMDADGTKRVKRSAAANEDEAAHSDRSDEKEPGLGISVSLSQHVGRHDDDAASEYSVM